MARRTFFSFHYKPDVWRAWNVRNCWVVKPEEQIADGCYTPDGLYPEGMRDIAELMGK